MIICVETKVDCLSNTNTHSALSHNNIIYKKKSIKTIMYKLPERAKHNQAVTYLGSHKGEVKGGGQRGTSLVT